MSRRSSRTLRGQRGVVLAEFAVSVLFGMTMIFGVVDFGLCLFSYNAVTNAAEVGSRYAMVRGSACTAADCPATAATVQTYVRGRSAGINESQLTVTPSWAAGAGCSALPLKGPGCVVTVVATYPFRFFSPFVPQLSWTMTSTSKMIIAQ